MRLITTLAIALLLTSATLDAQKARLPRTKKAATPAAEKAKPTTPPAEPAAEPAAEPTAPAKPPALTADEVVLLETVQQLQQLANMACQTAPAYTAYNAAAAKVNTRIATNHPGYRLNWQTMTLVPATSVP